jgi:large subunit ribosomal protein L17
MRHRKNFNHLGRKTAHRSAMLSNMANSLIMHKRINTTVAKAKALRSFVEPMITRAKNDTTHNRREVFSDLQNKEAVNELFREVIVKVGDRPGGYTRILKTGTRLGDNAEMCLMELVDYNENMLQDSDKKKTTRRRRSRKKTTDEKVETGKVAVETKAKKTEVVEKSDVVENIDEEASVDSVEQIENVVDSNVEDAQTLETEDPKEEADTKE